MRIKLLFIKDGKINRKLNQVKFLQTLFGLSLKEAKDAVDSGEFIHIYKIYSLKNVFFLIRKNMKKSVKN